MARVNGEPDQKLTDFAGAWALLALVHTLTWFDMTWHESAIGTDVRGRDGGSDAAASVCPVDVPAVSKGLAPESIRHGVGRWTLASKALGATERAGGAAGANKSCG